MQNKGVFIIGLLLILFGVIFLLANIEFIDLAKIWPLIPLLVGIGFLISFFQSKKDYGLLMPGSILTIVSLLLFYCNLAGWNNMGILWPVFIIAPAGGFFMMYFLGLKEKGLLIPAFILTGVGAIFLMINTYFGIFWPILFIVAGLVIIAINIIKRSVSSKVEPDGEKIAQVENRADKASES